MNFDDFDGNVRVTISTTNILHSLKYHHATTDIITMTEARRRHARFPRLVKGCCRKWLAEDVINP